MAGFSLGRFYCTQRRVLPQPKAIEDVSSKTFMVTGSNVGLGFEASVQIVKMAPKLLIATSRDLAKCEQTQKSIIERAGIDNVSGPAICVCPLEMGSFQNVSSFVDRFAADENGALNALVANAGVKVSDYSQTQDGWETTLQVNYLSTALLSILLLPSLIKSSSADSPSRLVVVSSFTHYLSKEAERAGSWSNILGTMNQRNFGNGNSRYCISKLLQVVFIHELASRLPEPTPVIACTIDPGFCRSEILRNDRFKWVFPLFNKLFLIRSAEEGSRTLVHGAVATDRSMHGRYLDSCEVAEESSFLFTPEGKAFAARLWDETITILSGVDGRVSEIVEKYLRAVD